MNEKYVACCGNPGEHFAAVEAGAKMIETARMATAHLAFTVSSYLSDGPVLVVGIRNVSELEALISKQDQQSTEPKVIPERVKNDDPIF